MCLRQDPRREDRSFPRQSCRPHASLQAALRPPGVLQLPAQRRGPRSRAPAAQASFLPYLKEPQLGGLIGRVWEASPGWTVGH